MYVGFPDGTARQLHEQWRIKLAEAEGRHALLGTAESRAELRTVLQVFAGLGIRGKLPDDPTS